EVAVLNHGVVRASGGHESFEGHGAQIVQLRKVLNRRRNQRAPEPEIDHAFGLGQCLLRKKRLCVTGWWYAYGMLQDSGDPTCCRASRAALEAFFRLAWPRLVEVTVSVNAARDHDLATRIDTCARFRPS